MVKKFIKKQKNPFSKKMEETGVATLTEEQAKTLNDIKGFTGIIYELDESDGGDFDAKKAKKPELVEYAKINEIELGEATKIDDIRAKVLEFIKSKE